MWTLQPLQASLNLLLIAVIVVTFLLDRHLWVHDNNVELHMLTNQEVTFSTHLKLKINTNIPATTMDDHLGNNNSFNSFATAQDGFVSESEEDDYHDDNNNEVDEEEGKDNNDDEVNEDEEEEDTVAEELPFSPVRSFSIQGIKHGRGKKTPPPPPRPRNFKTLTPSRKVKPRVSSTVPTSQNSSIITSNQSKVTQAPTKKVYRIGGTDIVCENKATNTSNVAVATFKKADRDTMSIRDKNSLITLISSNQQMKFKNLSINTTELEKLGKTHSLKLLISKLRTNFARYNLLTAFTIITCTNFITGDIDIDNSTGKANGYDLFKDYRRLTSSEVAKSNQWYVQFTQLTLRMEEDMN